MSLADTYLMNSWLELTLKLDIEYDATLKILGM